MNPAMTIDESLPRSIVSSSDSGSDGQSTSVTPMRPAVRPESGCDLLETVSLDVPVAPDSGPLTIEELPPGRWPSAVLISAIRFAHRRREDYLRPALSLNNQVKAIGRRVEADRRRRAEGTLTPGTLSPDGLRELVTRDLLRHQDELLAESKVSEKQLRQLARQLPVWPWVESVRGAGDLGLAQIVAECGDLSNYANPAKVWKRMGLAVQGGVRQQRTKDKATAIVMGYSPFRRKIAYLIADSLVKQNKGGEYRAVYDEQKAAKLALGWTKGHAHAHAHRLAAKRYLRDLWREWNRVRASAGNQEEGFRPPLPPEVASC